MWEQHAGLLLVTALFYGLFCTGPCVHSPLSHWSPKITCMHIVLGKFFRSSVSSWCRGFTWEVRVQFQTCRIPFRLHPRWIPVSNYVGDNNAQMYFDTYPLWPVSHTHRCWIESVHVLQRDWNHCHHLSIKTSNYSNLPAVLVIKSVDVQKPVQKNN